MDLETFKQSLRQSSPPTEMTPALRALWYAKNQHWDRAHEIVQDETGGDSAWVHAFLHREEGDYGNALYWYGQARQPAVAKDMPLADEWEQIVEDLLLRGG